MPSDFKEILAIDTNSRLNDKSPKKVIERLLKAYKMGYLSLSLAEFMV